MRRRVWATVLLATVFGLAGCATDRVGVTPNEPAFLGQSDGIVWPVRTTVWSTFDTAMAPRISQYLPLNKAAKTWRICVSVPTRDVEYYESILTGIRTQAKAERVSITVVSGGLTTSSYDQAKFTAKCASDTQALVLAPVLDAQSGTAYSSLLAAQRAAHKPVVVTSPGLSATGVTASMSPVPRLGAQQLGYWLNADANTRPAKVIVLAGPKGQPQIQSMIAGLVSTLPGSSLSLAGIYYGSLQPAAQAALVRKAIAAHPDAKYIVGVSGAIVAAVDVLHTSAASPYVLGSFTYTEKIAALIPDGRVAVAVDDRTVAQGAIALDYSVRLLQGSVLAAVNAPAAQLIDRTSITYLDQTGSLPNVLAANE